MPKKPVEVTVAGGGIAGITAALKLAQRGYEVTLFEDKPWLGGNVGAHRNPANGVYYDVYPHMFSTFYKNFWSLVEDDLGIQREDAFQPRESVKILKKGGKYVEMTDGMPIRNAWKNLFEGAQPPADMLIWVYSMLDLMSEPMHRRELLDGYTVNGFMRSRPYATDRAAALHDFVLMVIWSAHSYGVSAAAYKDFFSLSLREPSPFTWVLRGDLHTHLIAPLERKLEDLGVTVRKCRQVTKIVVEGGRVSTIHVQESEFDHERLFSRLKADGEKEVLEVENLILAMNPRAVGWLAQVGDAGKRIVDRIPSLRAMRQTRAEPIAVLTLYFKDKLPDIPPEHVSLWDSPMNLSFLDLSQVWDDLEADGRGAAAPTVLTVAASDYYGLPSSFWTPEGRHQDIVAMVRELEAYLPQVGGAEIDFEKTHFHTNRGDELFINDVGSERWRPPTFNEEVPNLFLAGGYCLNDVGMATVEAATTTGLLAAQALHQRSPLGEALDVGTHEAYPPAAINAMKLAMMPLAYQAKWWSASTDAIKSAAKLEPPTAWAHDLASLYALPGHFLLDLWETSARLYTSSWRDLGMAVRRSTRASDK